MSGLDASLTRALRGRRKFFCANPTGYNEGKPIPCTEAVLAVKARCHAGLRPMEPPLVAMGMGVVI